jgi:hypothetical protein
VFLARHFLAVHDECSQQRFVFSPLHFATLLVVAEHKLDPEIAPKEEIEGVRSGERGGQEMGTLGR